MQRIETRTQLVNFICENISQSAVARACHSGTVQVLGGFSRVHPMLAPGWVVAVTSIHGRTWLVAVTTDDHRHVYRIGVVKTIPWEYYIGRADQEGYSVYNGDNPQQSCLAKERL